LACSGNRPYNKFKIKQSSPYSPPKRGGEFVDWQQFPRFFGLGNDLSIVKVLSLLFLGVKNVKLLDFTF
jgi:hypothetical protein